MGLCLPGLNALSFDPATNNDPLQFNGSGGPLGPECPPLENASENSKKRKRASLPPGTDSKLLYRKWTLQYGFASNLLLLQHKLKKLVQKLCNAVICASTSGDNTCFFWASVYLLISLPCPEAVVVWSVGRSGSCSRKPCAQLSLTMLTTPANQNCWPAVQTGTRQRGTVCLHMCFPSQSAVIKL